MVWKIYSRAIRKMAGKPKGSPKTGGRSAGTPNKITADLREMILGALEDVGGRAYLASKAEENPGPFLTLVGKCLPKEIKAEIAATHVISNLTPEQQRGIAEAILLGK